ncbi:MAG: cytochrome c biogenesis protein CcsA [Rubrivivax sp.]|nr:cytochrome c biogenesis protein CcsA [Rubrivivax sp.]
MDEGWMLRAALGSYAAAWLAPARWPRLVMLAAALALGLHTASLLLRWAAHGHGPFTTMHEILSSSLWSLALVLALAAAALSEARAAWRLAAPLLALLALWALVAPPGRGHFPPTYATALLYVHAVLGKLFLGLLLVAVALGSVPLARRTPIGARRFAAAPGDARFDELAHRFAAFAFVADTLMLIAGAVWAQDAWGRYWAWDPLETWAFATWLALAGALHARATLRPAPVVHGLWLAAIFALAFLTFFGVPFLSTSPHKGAI